MEPRSISIRRIVAGPTPDTRARSSWRHRGTFLVVYTSKVRITVRTDREKIVREGHGCGEARGVSAGEAHDLALKISETDATKRALATFGKPFGLALYLGGKSGRKDEGASAAPATACVQELPRAIDYQSAGPHPNKAREPERANSNGIDKSVLTIGAARRHRDKDHLRFVASQPCLLCERQPSDPHHLRFAQPRGLGMKVSDEFTVPLCRDHHRQLHHSGNETSWWYDMGIER
jgi:Rad52/22 family double-strand break repair protein